MRRRTVLIATVAAALAACSRQPRQKAGEAAPGAPDPAATVAPLYQPYIAGAPLVGLENQAPWSVSMRDALVAMMARSNAINEPILDFDPFIGAQDSQISNLTVTTEAVVENSHATVRAHFSNFDRQDEIVYDLIWEAGGWRVDNIRGSRGGDWDLRKIVTAPAQ